MKRWKRGKAKQFSNDSGWKPSSDEDWDDDDGWNFSDMESALEQTTEDVEPQERYGSDE